MGGESTPDEKDWRLQGQENYLKGATLLWKPYRAMSQDWEHDHGEFCWATFMDPMFSAGHAKAIAADPDILTDGYAVQGRSPREGSKNDYWWICRTCARNLARRFAWTMLDSPGFESP
jgi:hypothetical protein